MEEKTITIPASLAERIKKRCEGTEFNNISAYVTHVLEELLASMEQKTAYSKEDEEKVKERLKALGYL